MDAESLLRSGDLSGALSALQNAVRSDPSNPKLRVFLFQLLSVLGDWKRAITQLKVSAELDHLAIPMAQTYREAIICEVYREKVFAGEKEPLVFGEPQEWVALLAEALKLDAAGREAEASDLRSRAFDDAPAIGGTLNDEPFEWIADADMRLGPILEIIINGRYFWMPFTAVTSLTMEPPEDLRDSVWMPATVNLPNEGSTVALVPTRYVGTTEASDDAAKLARVTNWTDAGDGTFVGIGQRLLATDAGDTALMDLRSLQMTVPEVSDTGDHG